MSRILTGRSENAIKNRFNSLNSKGLAETRANELMAKLAPEEKAEFMLKDMDRDRSPAVPAKPAAASKMSASRRAPSKRPSSSSSSNPPLSRYGDSNRARGGAGHAGTTGSKDSDRFGKEGESPSSALGFYGDGSGDGGGSDDDDDRFDARAGRNSSGVVGSEDGGGGSGGTGGLAAMQALMVAADTVGDDRAVSTGTDSHGGGGGGEDGDESDDEDGRDCSGRRRAGAGGKRGRSPMTDGGGRRRWEGEAGYGGHPGNRGAKREKGGQARRKPVREKMRVPCSIVHVGGLLARWDCGYVASLTRSMSVSLCVHALALRPAFVSNGVCVFVPGVCCAR